jgi:hypothetical protein
MSRNWITSKRNEFVRDTLRDFCLVSRQFETVFETYDASGQISFDHIRDLIGKETCKGELWRLKDTAHLLFQSEPPTLLVGRFLEWALGSLFHEAVKLMEDAYQLTNYKPWFLTLQRGKTLRPEEQLLGSELYSIIEQTADSIRREVKRIRFLLFHCRRMFILYLPAHVENPLLARFLYDQNDLVRSIFKSCYEDLVRAVYENRPERMYVLASRSLRQGGWVRDAGLALEMAENIRPDNPMVLQEKMILASFQQYQ